MSPKANEDGCQSVCSKERTLFVLYIDSNRTRVKYQNKEEKQHGAQELVEIQ